MSTLSSPVNDPAYWQQRAEETRVLSDQLDDPIAKQTMLEIALSYEQLAASSYTGPRPRAGVVQGPCVPSQDRTLGRTMTE
jgi:hypothetical protein